MTFVKQVIRKDILSNILNNSTLSGIELFKLIISDNNSNPLPDKIRTGFIFETICIILELCKCISIDYNEFLDGQLQSLHKIKNINNILKNNIRLGNNASDMTIKQNNTLISFSIKYLDDFNADSGCQELDNTLLRLNIDYKIGLIVKDKKIYENHKFNNKLSSKSVVINKIINDNLLLDESDIIIGLDTFCKRFINKKYNTLEFIELINTNYLLSPRIPLKNKLNQQLAFHQFLRNRKHNLHLVSHKPRSGKSITLLNISRYLLENETTKILIMTAVPATIDSFIKDLDKYIDFQNIKYVNQDEFKTLDSNFKGIVFCSVQYLKINGEEKKQYLKNIKFDVMIIDECHIGSSTKKTENEILNIDTSDINTLEDIRNNIKLNIFASGTSDKTKQFYKIKNSNVYEWEIEDEGFMKELMNDSITNEDKTEILDIMTKRHGIDFIDCYNDSTLNKDYSKHPIQVLLKHSIPENIIAEIQKYNTNNNTNYGYSCSSLFALDKIKNKKTNKYEYDNIFELEKSSDGIELLTSFFECIISNNRMNKNTIMKKIEETQSTYKSRLSKKGEPKLFIIYLPTHTGNNTINQLQFTLKKFIEHYKLWNDYNIEYSNSVDDTGDSKETYNHYIKTIINKALNDNKKGCILLLGNKGSVGITYDDCDVTISLDDGHNLDNQKQRYSRALTEASNKTIGINVDMNIQRTYLYLNSIIHKHKTIIKTNKTHGEILKYLYEHNIFLFNPTDIQNGKVSSFEITSYYNKEAESLSNYINYIETDLINNLIIGDNDIILDNDEIAFEYSFDNNTNQHTLKEVNPNLEGEQQECPKGDIIKTYIDDDINNSENAISDDSDTDDSESTNSDTKLLNEKEKKEHRERYYKNVCIILFKFLGLLSRTYQQLEFKDMLFHQDTKDKINSILKDKKIILNKNKYNSIINIMDNNTEMITNLREIYRTAPPEKIHYLISKHFIPTNEEKKNHAEIPTAIELVQEMLDKLPIVFWTTPKKVFELCCGKGNFVMKIFEKFFIGLKELYPDVIERCTVIITQCLYFADLTELNVFITTEILKCEVQRYTGIEDITYIFNKNVGNTLELNILTKWNINDFDAIIGNPPYEDKDATGDNKLYLEFTKYALTILTTNGYLLFITPRNILDYILLLDKNRKYIDNFYQINYIAIETSNKYFKNVNSTFAYFLIEKKPYYKKTIIEYLYCNKLETIELLLEKGYKIPRVLTKLDIQIINKITSKTNNFIFNDFMFETKTQRIRKHHFDKEIVFKKETDTHKIKIIDTINKTNVFPGIYYYYNKKDNVFNINKLVLSKKGYLMPYIDNTKEYTYSDNFKYISGDNLDKIKMLFESTITKYLLFQYSKNGFDSIDIIKTLHKKILNNIQNEEDLYKLYNLSVEEITHIKLLLGVNDTNINNTNTNTNTSTKIIKDGRKQYYLIEDKLYKVKKDKSQGELFGNYVDGNIIENVKQKKSKKTNNNTTNETLDEVTNTTIIKNIPLHKKIIFKNKTKKETTGITFQELLNNDTIENNESN